MSANDVFQNKIKFFGNYSGDTFNILRPNYAQVDNTPALVYSNLIYRIRSKWTILS